ncbi:hypothetical protein IW138_002557 [Coemansia sp. RSA 986]|nr:hypothetical protein IW138_002557 [Coemansia sp. RSA 986]
MQQYSSPTVLNGLPACSQGPSQQQVDDQNIVALNNFLGITSTTMPLSSPQQPITSACSNEQAIAAFLASTTSAYTDVPILSLPIQESPMLLNSIGTTPAQSIQSIQLSDIGSDVAAIATDIGSNALFGQQPLSSAGFDPSLNMFNSVPASRNSTRGAAVNQSLIQQPHVTQSYLSPSGALDQQQQQQQQSYYLDANSVLGKHKRAEDIDDNGFQDLFGPIGVPLSKRVSMPASYGATANMFCGTSASNAAAVSNAVVGAADSCSIMPIPTGMAMQRIASYHPGIPISTTTQLPLVGSADGTDFSFAPAKVPISRLNTTAAVMTTASANTENSVFDNISSNPQTSSPLVFRKVAHNAIERRYRNNINDRIRDLRNSVPALQNIRPKANKHHPGIDINNDDNDDGIDDDNDNEESAIVVDGVEAATKLNKATVLGKSTEYIYHLRRNNDLYKRESLYLQEILRKMPDGDKIIEKVLQMAKQDSAVATATLYLPESSSSARSKKKRI